jgi:hypothetical protein
VREDLFVSSRNPVTKSGRVAFIRNGPAGLMFSFKISIVNLQFSDIRQIDLVGAIVKMDFVSVGF